MEYSDLHKKTNIRFSKKKFLHKYVFKIPLWREFDKITCNFLISSINLKIIYLSFHWFNDSWTCGHELVTRGFELVTRGFENVTPGFELVAREFERALLNFNSCF